MSDSFIGEIRMFAGNFPPRGWAFCNGQVLPIAQNTPLFALLGTTYGGNGTSTFALPDLRSRVPIGQGQGPGLSPRSLGETVGVEAVTLVPGEMPAHDHTLFASSNAASGSSGAGSALGTSATAFYAGGPATGAMAADAIAPAGGGQPHPNLAPSAAVNFIIALQGFFPQRP